MELLTGNEKNVNDRSRNDDIFQGLTAEKECSKKPAPMGQITVSHSLQFQLLVPEMQQNVNGRLWHHDNAIVKERQCISMKLHACVHLHCN